MLAFAGETARATRTAGVTVSVADPEILPDMAVTVVVPAATEVARPFEPAALLMVAAEVFEELQVTAPVRFCVEESV